jgi:hypothetical protein
MATAPFAERWPRSRKCRRLICRGHTDVVNADLSRYFDSIPHGELLKSVARPIVDRHVLRLIKLWLKAPIEERDDGDGTRPPVVASRIMTSKDGFVQAYNAQAAVDAGAQIIVPHELTQCGNDQGQLVPLIEAIENKFGRKPDQASADSGCCSESNLEALEAHGVDGYVAPGRAKHPTAANGKSADR